MDIVEVEVLGLVMFFEFFKQVEVIVVLFLVGFYWKCLMYVNLLGGSYDKCNFCYQYVMFEFVFLGMLLVVNCLECLDGQYNEFGQLFGEYSQFGKQAGKECVFYLFLLCCLQCLVGFKQNQCNEYSVNMIGSLVFIGQFYQYIVYCLKECIYKFNVGMVKVFV